MDFVVLDLGYGERLELRLSLITDRKSYIGPMGFQCAKVDDLEQSKRIYSHR